MSFETIKIYRDYQIINGFVQLPPNLEKDRNTATISQVLSDIDGSTEHIVSTVGSGPQTGSGFGAASTIRFEI
jgi:hypothetical protein